VNYSIQLKSILKASGWSQEELARRLGVSFVTLNSWVNSRSEPRKKAIESIRLLYFDVVGAEEIDKNELAIRKREAAARKARVRTIINDQKILEKLTLYLTYHTNTIEGSTMTLSDTEEVLFHHKVLANRTQIEQLEARNHQTALLWLLDQLHSNKRFTLDEYIVKGLHLRLMNGIISDAGQYRQHSVRILGARVTVANYLKIPELMIQLLTSIDNQADVDAIAALSITHAAFEKIHPFSDGNGRIGRLLMLIQALKLGLVPPLVTKERKQAYYKYLEMAQTKDNSLPLQLFIAEAVVEADELLFG
jgi:Fic family protein/DNA-binding XRE family transcriptional regulator